MNIYPYLRKLLFKLPPEVAHSISLNALHAIPQFCLPKIDAKPCQFMGLHFANRIGLAAGLDKSADHIDALAKLGFGFIEVGGVTPKPQLGNAKPRLFRVPEANAIINRMNLNNKGLAHVVKRVQQRRYQGILGVNICKNHETPIAQAVEDYLICMRDLYAHVDYLSINVSCPNASDLRDLSVGEGLSKLLNTLKAEQTKLTDKSGRYVPLVIKISPDLDEQSLREVGERLMAADVDGVIATNTTSQRPGLENEPLALEKGGLSGAPLLPRANQVLKLLKTICQDKLVIIGLGGIQSGADAEQKFALGADLIQVYTGLIYQGPQLIKDIERSLKS